MQPQHPRWSNKHVPEFLGRAHRGNAQRAQYISVFVPRKLTPLLVVPVHAKTHAGNANSVSVSKVVTIVTKGWL